MTSIKKIPLRSRGGGTRGSDPAFPTDKGSGHSGSRQTWVHRPNGIDSTYADLLGNNANDEFSQFLANLGIGQQKGLTGTQRDDYNKQILDTMLNYFMTRENRAYNESMRDEQRLYDSPTNQLARLMGAGISRDAALQFLGQGSEPIQSEAAVAGEGIAASESANNGLNQALAPIQTAADLIGAVGSLVGLGFSIPQAIQQTQFLRTQNLLSSQQLQGYSSASQAFGILNSIGASAESFGSASNAIKAIQEAAASGNTDSQSFIANGGMQQMLGSSYFASRALSDLYKSERSSSDYDRSFGLFVEQQEAEIDFKKADKQRVVQSVLNMQGELDEIRAQTDFINEQKGMIKYSINVLQAQAKLLDQQGKTEAARRLQIKAETLQTNLQNQYTQGVYNSETVDPVTGERVSGLDAMTHSAAVSAYNDLKKFVYAKNQRIWEKELNALAMNYDRMYNVALLNNAYTQGVLDKYNNNLEFADFMVVMSAFNECGAWDYINSMVNAGDDQLFGQKWKRFGVTDVQESVDKFKNKPKNEPWYKRNHKE